MPLKPRPSFGPETRALRRFAWPAAVISAAVWTGLLLLPMAALFGSLGANETLVKLLDPVIISIARVTFWQALLSAVLSLVAGLGLGLLVRPTRGMRAILAIPFAVPTVVAAAAWITWLGRTGLLGGALDWLYSFRAVILAHVALNAPWVALQVSLARMDIPGRRLDAAATLGAGAWARFRFVIFPEIRAAWLAAGAQVMALCSMSFALVLLLGGGPPVQSLETALYSRVRFGTLDLPGAAACACWQLAVASLPWLLVLFLKKRQVDHSESRGGARAGPSGRPPHVLLSAFTWIFALGFIFPYLAVGIPFFTQAGRMLLFAPETLAQLLLPLQVSLLIAAGSALGAVSLALAGIVTAASFGAWLAVPFTLSSGVSVLVLGLGFWLAFQKFIDPFAGSLPAIIALQTAVFSPLVFRSLWPVAQGARKRLLEAAWTLGANPLRAFSVVEWPRWRAPLVSAFALVAALSMGEVAAVSLFYSENLVPLPLLLSRWTGQYRFVEAQGLATMLLLLSATGIVIITLWGDLNVEDQAR